MIHNDLAVSSRQHALRDVKRAKMLEQIEHLRADFNHELQVYSNKAPLTTDDKTKLCERIVAVVAEVESLGDWDESLFLRNLITPMRQVRDNMQERLRELTGTLEEKIVTSIDYQCKTDEQLIYVLLFQTQGYNIKRWEQLLRSLSRAIVGRPIYAEEEHVQHIISRKLDHSNNAYAIAKISQNDILTEGDDPTLSRKDRYGHKILSVQQGCLTSDNIVSFVYENSIYRWSNMRLKEIRSL